MLLAALLAPETLTDGRWHSLPTSSGAAGCRRSASRIHRRRGHLICRCQAALGGVGYARRTVPGACRGPGTPADSLHPMPRHCVLTSRSCRSLHRGARGEPHYELDLHQHSPPRDRLPFPATLLSTPSFAAATPHSHTPAGSSTFPHPTPPPPPATASTSTFTHTHTHKPPHTQATPGRLALTSAASPRPGLPLQRRRRLRAPLLRPRAQMPLQW